ncbi:MAG TPA: hypothetical protein VMH26_02180 [Burkholderiales bacterium]|nr:hypothetical protein [Burkholderiales bacterium]
MSTIIAITRCWWSSSLDRGMNRLASGCLLVLISLATVTGCDIGTDAATRLAYDIEAGAGRLGKDTGATYSIQHKTPSKSGECVGPYTVQLDKVGALIVWCYDAAGHTVSSHSTSYHARFVDTPRTYKLDKPAGATLTIDLERRDGRAVITDVH